MQAASSQLQGDKFLVSVSGDWECWKKVEQHLNRDESHVRSFSWTPSNVGDSLWVDHLELEFIPDASPTLDHAAPALHWWRKPFAHVLCLRCDGTNEYKDSAKEKLKALIAGKANVPQDLQLVVHVTVGAPKSSSTFGFSSSASSADGKDNRVGRKVFEKIQSEFKLGNRITRFDLSPETEEEQQRRMTSQLAQRLRDMVMEGVDVRIGEYEEGLRRMAAEDSGDVAGGFILRDSIAMIYQCLGGREAALRQYRLWNRFADSHMLAASSLLSKMVPSQDGEEDNFDVLDTEARPYRLLIAQGSLSGHYFRLFVLAREVGLLLAMGQVGAAAALVLARLHKLYGDLQRSTLPLAPDFFVSLIVNCCLRFANALRDYGVLSGIILRPPSSPSVRVPSADTVGWFESREDQKMTRAREGLVGTAEILLYARRRVEEVMSGKILWDEDDPDMRPIADQHVGGSPTVGSSLAHTMEGDSPFGVYHVRRESRGSERSESALRSHSQENADYEGAVGGSAGKHTHSKSLDWRQGGPSFSGSNKSNVSELAGSAKWKLERHASETDAEAFSTPSRPTSGAGNTSSKTKRLMSIVNSGLHVTVPSFMSPARPDKGQRRRSVPALPSPSKKMTEPRHFQLLPTRMFHRMTSDPSRLPPLSASPGDEEAEGEVKTKYGKAFGALAKALQSDNGLVELWLELSGGVASAFSAAHRPRSGVLYQLEAGLVQARMERWAEACRVLVPVLAVACADQSEMLLRPCVGALRESLSRQGMVAKEAALCLLCLSCQAVQRPLRSEAAEGLQTLANDAGIRGRVAHELDPLVQVRVSIRNQAEDETQLGDEFQDVLDDNDDEETSTSRGGGGGPEPPTDDTVDLDLGDGIVVKSKRVVQERSMTDVLLDTKDRPPTRRDPPQPAPTVCEVPVGADLSLDCTLEVAIPGGLAVDAVKVRLRDVSGTAQLGRETSREESRDWTRRGSSTGSIRKEAEKELAKIGERKEEEGDAGEDAEGEELLFSRGLLFKECLASAEDGELRAVLTPGARRVMEGKRGEMKVVFGGDDAAQCLVVSWAGGRLHEGVNRLILSGAVETVGEFRVESVQVEVGKVCMGRLLWQECKAQLVRSHMATPSIEVEALVVGGRLIVGHCGLLLVVVRAGGGGCREGSANVRGTKGVSVGERCCVLVMSGEETKAAAESWRAERRAAGADVLSPREGSAQPRARTAAEGWEGSRQTRERGARDGQVVAVQDGGEIVVPAIPEGGRALVWVLARGKEENENKKEGAQEGEEGRGGRERVQDGHEAVVECDVSTRGARGERFAVASAGRGRLVGALRAEGTVQGTTAGQDRLWVTVGMESQSSLMPMRVVGHRLEGDGVEVVVDPNRFGEAGPVLREGQRVQVAAQVRHTDVGRAAGRWEEGGGDGELNDSSRCRVGVQYRAAGADAMLERLDAKAARAEGWVTVTVGVPRRPLPLLRLRAEAVGEGRAGEPVLVTITVEKTDAERSWGDHDLKYALEGGVGQWMLVGQTTGPVQLDSDGRWERTVSVIPVECGVLPLPQLKLTGVGEERVERVGGERASVLVLPPRDFAVACREVKG